MLTAKPLVPLLTDKMYEGEEEAIPNFSFNRKRVEVAESVVPVEL